MFIRFVTYNKSREEMIFRVKVSQTLLKDIQKGVAPKHNPLFDI